MTVSKQSDVFEFIREVRGKSFPLEGALAGNLKLDRTNFMQEELNEFWDAETIEEQVDALIDLQYFLLGTLYEMGVNEKQYDECWKRVHAANMRKKKGQKNGRTTLTGDDAGKPDDWTPPDFGGIFSS